MKCDCHIHMVLDGVYFADAISEHQNAVREDLVRERLMAYADIDVNYLRDGGDAWGVSLLAAKLAPEYAIDYVSPAFPIYKVGRYGSFIGLGYETEGEFLELLDKAEADGADFIKLMLSGIMDFDEFGSLSCEAIDADEMKKLISHAHNRGFAVMAHLNGDEAIKNAIIAGVDSVEHGNFMLQDTIKLLADSDAVWTPTLAPVSNAIGGGRFSDDALMRIEQKQMENVSLAASQGAYIALGSDAGAWEVFHPTACGDELRHMQKVLGSGAELVLGLGSAKIKDKFKRN